MDLTHFWLDQMAHDSARPFQERMAFFWHGHFCSEFGKVGSSMLMREQIDLWRREGLGNIRSLATTMSTQVAMIRYLDNNQNKKSSPNQNFARELMELFLLGVGNYTEADVEAVDGGVDRAQRPVGRRGRPVPLAPRVARLVAQGLPRPTHQHRRRSRCMARPRARDDLGDARRRRRSGGRRQRRQPRTTHPQRRRRVPLAKAVDVVRHRHAHAARRDDGDARRAARRTTSTCWPWVTAMLTHPDFYTDAVKRGPGAHARRVRRRAPASRPANGHARPTRPG